MRVLLIILTFCLSTALSGQGFYMHDELLYNPSRIVTNKVKSVTATYNYSDSLFHPFSNFIFEYQFNELGQVVSKTYWTSALNAKDSRFLTITLFKDSSFFDTKRNKWEFKVVKKSEDLIFDQHRKRTMEFIHKTYEKVLKSFLPGSTNTFYDIVDKNRMIDTTILGRKLQLPLFLLPFEDSLSSSDNGLFSFKIIDNKIFGKAYHHVNDKDEFIIDCYSIDDNEVWRSYIFDGGGRLIEEKQNIYKTIYSYSPNGLMIRVEHFTDNYSMKIVTLSYR